MGTVQKDLESTLRQELARRGWSVQDLANRTGLSAPGLYKMISGERWPGPDNLERIMRAFDMEQPSELFGGPVAVKKPTIGELRRSLDEKLAALENLPDLSRVDPVLLRRLATANEDELSAIELVFEAHAEGSGQGETELDETNGKERKKR